MSTTGNRLRLTAIVLAAGGLVTWGATLATAAVEGTIPGPDGVFTACYDGGGALKVFPSGTTTCPKGWTGPVYWNKTGPAGPAGPQGEKGDTGPAGEQGTKGDTGPAGPAGEDGTPGKSAYELALAQGYQGTLADWLGSLRGPAGPQGEPGPKGDAGPAGPQGEPGPAGQACTIVDNGDDTVTLTCGGTGAVLSGTIPGGGGPSCTDSGPDTQASALFLGTVSGDTGADAAPSVGSICAGDQDWYKFRVTENDSDPFQQVDLRYRVRLDMGSTGGDLDMAVIRGSLVTRSANSGTAPELFSGSIPDTSGDQSSDVYVQVIGSDATAVNDYTLSVVGNVSP